VGVVDNNSMQLKTVNSHNGFTMMTASFTLSRLCHCWSGNRKGSPACKIHYPLDWDSSVLQEISSNGRHPLPLECHGLVDQISWLACRQRVLETDFSRRVFQSRSVRGKNEYL